MFLGDCKRRVECKHSVGASRVRGRVKGGVACKDGWEVARERIALWVH